VIIWNFLKTHPQKLTGLLLVVIGSVQANLTMLQPLVSPKAFAVGTMITGALVAALGFINTTKKEDQ
jgi:hypothetical protein